MTTTNSPYLAEERDDDDPVLRASDNVVNEEDLLASLGEFIHADSPGSTLPSTGTRIGELFLRTGATEPGMYVAADMLGTWTGPIGAGGTDASLITTGTLADDRLSANVALVNASNTFTANQLIIGTLGVSGLLTAGSVSTGGTITATGDINTAAHLVVGTSGPRILNNVGALRFVNNANNALAPIECFDINLNGGVLTNTSGFQLTGNSVLNGPAISCSADGLLLTAGATSGVRINSSLNGSELFRVANNGNATFTGNVTVANRIRSSIATDVSMLFQSNNNTLLMNAAENNWRDLYLGTLNAYTGLNIYGGTLAAGPISCNTLTASSGVLAYSASVTAALTVGVSLGGYVGLVGGNGSFSGYFEWHKPTGARYAYMGYDSGNDLSMVFDLGGKFVVYGAMTSTGLVTASAGVTATSTATALASIATGKVVEIGTTLTNALRIGGLDGTPNYGMFLQNSNSSYPLLLQPSNGRVVIGNHVDDGVSKLQVTGNIAASGKLALNGVVTTEETINAIGNMFLRGASIGVGAQIYLGDSNFDNSFYRNKTPGIGAIGGSSTPNLGLYAYDGDRVLVGTISPAGLTLHGLLSVTFDSYLNRNTYFRGIDYLSRVTIVGDAGSISATGLISTSNTFRSDSGLGSQCDFGSVYGGGNFSFLLNSLLVLNISSLKDFRIPSDHVYGWASTTTNLSGVDTGFARNAAGVVEVNNGTVGTFRDLKVRDLTATGDATVSRIGIGGFSPSTYGVPFSVLGQSVFQGSGVVNGGSVLSLFCNALTGTLNVFNAPVSVTGDARFYLFNNNAAGNASLTLLVGVGTSDPQSQYQVNGGASWTTGIDQSDSSKFKISNSSVLGATDRLIIDSAGNVGVGVGIFNSLAPLQVRTGTNRNIGFFDFAGLTAINSYTDDGSSLIPMQFRATSFSFLTGNATFAGDLTATGTITGTFTKSYGLTGCEYFGFGAGAGVSNSGVANTGLGTNALNGNTTGTFNTASGYHSLLTNTTGYYNTANGAQALGLNTTGLQNTAIGAQSLYSNTTGSNNTANGMQSLYQNTTGATNTACGAQALYFNATGSNNTAIGFQTLFYSTNGTANTAIGMQVLFNNSTGFNNTGIGLQALYLNTTGYHNVAVGLQSLFYNTTGYNNTAVGYQCLYNNTTGSNNTASGFYTMQANTTGSSNTAYGVYSLYYNTTGDSNVATGVQSLFNNTTGTGNVANGFNTFYSNTTGSYNTALGHYAGYGDGTPNQATTVDTYGLFLGFQASRDSSISAATVLTNITSIGKNAKVATNNSIVLGGTGADAVNVGIGTASPATTLHVVGDVTVTGYTKLGNAAVAGTPTPTHTLTLKDSTGTTYRIPCLV